MVFIYSLSINCIYATIDHHFLLYVLEFEAHSFIALLINRMKRIKFWRQVPGSDRWEKVRKMLTWLVPCIPLTDLQKECNLMNMEYAFICPFSFAIPSINPHMEPSHLYPSESVHPLIHPSIHSSVLPSNYTCIYPSFNPFTGYMNWFYQHFFQTWNNPHLSWNSTKYGGLKTININPKLVWLPDIVLYDK